MIKHKKLSDFFEFNSDLRIIANPSPSTGKEYIFGYTISQATRDDIYNKINACINCVTQDQIDSAQSEASADLAKIAS